MRSFLLSCALCVVVVASLMAPKAASAATSLHFFEREDCGFCAKEREYLRDFAKRYPEVPIVTHDILNDREAKALFDRIVESAGLPKVTPLTVIGDAAIQGFDPKVTPAHIERRYMGVTAPVDLERTIVERRFIPLSAVGKGCDAGEGLSPCDASPVGAVSVPFLGEVSTASLSLFSLSAVLGFVDGFNPCAMWVLITFLILLSQINNRRTMAYAAGLFIIAEALTYNLILNLWYATWDFIELDRIVTPLVGFLALGSGVWFLWRWRKSRANTALVCDVTGEESSVITRMQKLITSPFSLASAVGIIGIALSVNVIEFACSIGIPQAFTKVLEMNDLTALTRQWYLTVYTLGYMVDDFIVFGLALWGYKHLHASGAKYSRLSLLVGGLGLLILGVLLVWAPELLVWGA